MANTTNIIITGVLGQDGSNLAEYLLETTEHNIFGVYKRGANTNTSNIKSIKDNPRFKLILGDITDQTSMDNLVLKIQPDYFINFAANSFVGTSWDTPGQVFNVNTIGVLNCLEALRKFKIDCRFYSAGSSEEYGEIDFVPQTEEHRLSPISPYSVAKVAARHTVSVYRNSYNMFAIHGTLFNHEGPKRGTEFVTRKITKNIARICKELEETGTATPFQLGYIYAEKDWSDSRDMVRGIWMMLQQDTPREFILASGKTRTVKDFAEIAFTSAGYKGYWDEKDSYFIKLLEGDLEVISISKDLFRPTETGVQCGDYSKAKEFLGWEPEISFEDMVKEMVENDKRLIS